MNNLFYKGFSRQGKETLHLEKTLGAIDSKTALWFIFSLVVAGYMIFFHLGLSPLINPDEGRNASIAWEMQTSGHWLIPTYDGLPYLDKPSLFFKMVATSLALFGHNEFAARLPSALSAVGILAIIFIFCCREYNIRTAILSVLIVSTTPLFIAFSRTVIFDMPLAFFVCAAILAGYSAEKAKGNVRKRWYAIYAVMAGTATLVKGPVGLVLPILVLTVFNYFDGRKGANRRLLSWKNFLISLVVIMPWFVGVSILHPDFVYYGLVKETFLRFTTNSFHRSGPFYYYIPVLFGTFLFWSLLLPEMSVILWRQRKNMQSADRLLCIWAVSVILFFSLSHSKLPGYILTAVIALGILTARLFDVSMQHESSAETSIAWHGSLFLFTISALLVIALMVLYIRPEPVNRWLYHTHSPAVLQGIQSMTLPAILLFLGIAILAFTGMAWRNVKATFFAFLVFPLAVPSLIPACAVPIMSGRSDRSMVTEIRRSSHNAEIVCLRCFPAGLPFYLERPVTIFTGYNGYEVRSNYIRFYLSKTSKWPSHIKRAGDFESWSAHRRHAVFLIVKARARSQLGTIVKGYHGPVQRLGTDYWGLLLKPRKGH